MDMTYLTGRSFTNITQGFRDEHDVWRVSVVMTEDLLYPNGTGRTEEIKGLAENKDFDVAHKTAMQSVLQQLQDLVYSRGFDSLIEAMDYERTLEEGDDSNAKADEAPASE
jgi:hypothetical protein